MRAEILSIGTEILVGSILNTNSRFLSQRLAENAVDVYRHSTVGDNPERLIGAFEEAASRADLIITSGGLGPTEDDVTVRAAAAFLGQPLYLHGPTRARIVKRLKKRRLPMTKLIERQCYVPKGSTILLNDYGTAPGVLSHFRYGGMDKYLLLLPGPPRELEPMFMAALPLLKKVLRLKNEAFVVRSVRIAGLIEVQAAAKVHDLLIMKPPVTVGIYAKPGHVELKIMSKASSLKKAKAAADRIERIIRKRFGKSVYGTDNDTLASSLGALLRKQRKTLAIAESCTGGLASHLVTAVPGSSDYFLGSVVCYSNRIKEKFLGVPRETLATYGAVSEQTAVALAMGVRERFGADYGLGITGIAGPTGGSSKKPVGLVYIALASGKKTTVKKYLFLGKRADIQLRAAETTVDLLRKII